MPEAAFALRTVLSGCDRLPTSPGLSGKSRLTSAKGSEVCWGVERRGGGELWQGRLRAGPWGAGRSGSPCSLGVPSRAPRPAFCFGKRLPAPALLLPGTGRSEPATPSLPPRLPVLGSLALCRQKPLLVCVSLFLSRCLLLLFLLGIQHFEHGLHAGHESRSRVAMATSWALRAGELRALRTRTSGCQGRREGKGPEHGHAPVERPSGRPRARLQGDVPGAALASDTRCHVWRSRDHRQVQ